MTKTHLRHRALRRVAELGGIVLLACVVLASIAEAAKAPTLTFSSPVTPGARYLALGDSVTFGYQESSVVPTPNYERPASFHGYPEQLGSELHLKVTNVACPGETSASLINSAAPSLGCENGYRRSFPLHVRYSGSQLAFAVTFLRKHRNVRLVSLMIGANDAFRCQGTTPDRCASRSERRALFAEVSHNVRTILSAIRHRARYHGQLAIVNYYSLNNASAVSNAASVTLNQAVDAAAVPFDVVIADGYRQFRIASAHSGYNPCLAGLLTQLGMPGRCGIHPSYVGQTLLAKAVAAAIRP